MKRAVIEMCLAVIGLMPLSIQASEITTATIDSWADACRGFEPNLGQIGDFEGNVVNNILCAFKGNGMGIFINENGVSYVIHQFEKLSGEDEIYDRPISNPKSQNHLLHYARIDLELVNSNLEKLEINYEDELPGYTNYYLPQCPDGILYVKSYKKVRIKEIYPGIDWVWRYEAGRLHHEFEVSPNADVSRLKLRVKYADIDIKKGGRKLIYSTPTGKIEDGEILAYTEGKEVAVSYRIEDGLIGLDIKSWEKKGKLIIDPPLALLWGTYYGGNFYDSGNSIATDSSGNIFVTGVTWSPDFPTHDPGGGAYYQGTHAGGDDAFILKFTNTGVRQWATYYGGYDEDWGNSITTDSSGNVFLTGVTWSPNFPTHDPGGGAYYQGTPADGWDAFVLKFTNTGVRQWATYYGGNGDDTGRSITADSAGNVFVTGNTFSTNFPTQDAGGGAYYQGTLAGVDDTFVLQFTNTGVRQWATYYGGNGAEWGNSVAADRSGNIFVSGHTYSTDFPTQDPGSGTYYQGTNAGGGDIFVLKFLNTGIRQWATYYGGDVWESGNSITTDNSGHVFLTGYTSSTNFPTQNAGSGAYYQGTLAGVDDAFVLQFTNTGVRQWATYYGGNDRDRGSSITADSSGNVFVTGHTLSADFPTQDPGGGAYYQSTKAGSYDAFILELTNTGVCQWATYYGGNEGDFSHSITTDSSGNVLVTGHTSSTDLPTQNPGGSAFYQGANAGYHDGFILKFETSLGIEEKNARKNKPSGLSISSFFINTIRIDLSPSSEKPMALVLYNILGQKIFSRSYPETKSLVLEGREIEELSKGIYFLSVYSGKKEIGRVKLIKR